MNDEVKELAAIIVVYYPEVNCLLDMIRVIRQKADMVFVVDNTDSKRSIALYENQISDLGNIKHIVLTDNFGISKAHNIGLQMAFSTGYEYAILLDQDSIVTEELVHKLSESIKHLEKERTKVACIGPIITNKDMNEGVPPKLIKNKKSRYIDTWQIISSGSIIVRGAFEEVGGMDERLFIDYVDLEWCFRAKSKGYHTFIDIEAFMGHKIGLKNITVNFFGKRLVFCVPQPFRHYYQFRNLLLLLPRKYIPVKWKIKELVKKIVEIFVYSCYVYPRKTRLKMILQGIWHGIRNKNGKYAQRCKVWHW